MADASDLGILFLHALPLDGGMWAAQMGLLPDSSHAPSLYGFGARLEDWAQEALQRAPQKRLILVGCSLGGSCALEIAAAAPERVAALVLMGTKARHSPEPEFRAKALGLIAREGLAAAWETYWAPLFSPACDRQVIAAARDLALHQSPADIARGIAAFHSRKSRDDAVALSQVPVTVIAGADDPAPGLEQSNALAASAPRGCLKVVPAYGHYLPLEQPEALKAILQGIIASQV